MNSVQTSGGTGKATNGGIDDVDELVAATPTQRNWRGILISLLVIGLVSSLIVTCVILLTPPDLGPRIRGHLITLEDLVKATYKVQHDNAAWITDDEIAFRDDDGGISVFNVRENTSAVLVSNVTLRQKHTERFLVSPDLNFVILIGKQTKLTEYTGEALCWLWHVNDGQPAFPDFDAGSGFGDVCRHAHQLKPEPRSESHPPLQHVAWVPRPGGSARGNTALLMVHDGNLYYKEYALSADSYPVTRDGRPGLVHHGVPDLLYAEHILRSDSAVWPSPGGTLLLYFTINCTAVSDLKYTEYGAGAEPSYPRVRSVKYPRAGTTNPALTVTIANVTELGQMSYQTVLPPSSLSNRELYAAGVRWMDDSRVSVTWYNRRQNASFVSVCSAPSWRCQSVYQPRPSYGWVPIGDSPVFSEDRSSAVLLDRAQDGDDGFYTQIFMVELGSSSRSVTQMTQERADVTRILSWTQGFIYYLSAVEGSPGQRHLHRVSADSSPLQRTVECLSCPASAGDSDTPPTIDSDSATASDSSSDSDSAPCLQYEAVMRSSGGRYALRCVGPAVPRLTLPDPEVTLRNNTVLRAAAANLSLPAVRMISVPLQDGGEAAVRLLVPPQYRDGDEAAYPLLLWLAPAAPVLAHGDAPAHEADEAADQRWRVDWPAYLAAQQSFVVASVDLPAESPPSDPDRMIREPAVGGAEVVALRRVLDHLTEKLDFVSAGRVLAAGRGYGAYLALSLLGSGEPQPLRCAVAIAPITNWELYASAASERRLGMPDQNHRGYSESEMGGRAGAGAAGTLVGRRLMLVHGTADTSVSVQHTLLLSRRLEKAGAIFRQMLYPDEGHQLDGVQEHLYRTLDQYLHECFLPDNVRELVSEVI